MNWFSDFISSGFGAPDDAYDVIGEAVDYGMSQSVPDMVSNTVSESPWGMGYDAAASAVSEVKNFEPDIVNQIQEAHIADHVGDFNQNADQAAVPESGIQPHFINFFEGSHIVEQAAMGGDEYPELHASQAKPIVERGIDFLMQPLDHVVDSFRNDVGAHLEPVSMPDHEYPELNPREFRGLWDWLGAPAKGLIIGAGAVTGLGLGFNIYQSRNKIKQLFH